MHANLIDRMCDDGCRNRSGTAMVEPCPFIATNKEAANRAGVLFNLAKTKLHARAQKRIRGIQARTSNVSD